MLLLRYYLWIVPHLLCGAALVIGFRNKLQRIHPAFISLLAFEFLFELCFLLVITFSFSVATYRWCVVIGVGVGFVLELIVLYELLSRLVVSRLALHRIFRPIPRWTFAIFVMAA